MSMSHLGNFRKAVLFQMFGYKNKIWGYNYDPCSIDSEAAVKPLQQILLQYSGQVLDQQIQILESQIVMCLDG